MNKYYFIDKDGNRQGPRTIEHLTSADITPETLVWCKGMDKWQRAKAVEDFQPLFCHLKEKSEMPKPVRVASSPVVPSTERPKLEPIRSADRSIQDSSSKNDSKTMLAVMVINVILILAMLLWFAFFRDNGEYVL